MFMDTTLKLEIFIIKAWKELHHLKEDLSSSIKGIQINPLANLKINKMGEVKNNLENNLIQFPNFEHWSK